MEIRLGLDYTAVFAVLSELVEIGLVVMNPSGEMDFASGRARSLLGCGDDLSVDGCPREVQSTLAEIVHDVRSGAVRSSQKQIRFEANGKSHDLNLEGYPIDEGDCSGVLILVRDADIMRKMAQDLRLSAQLRNTRRLYQAVVHDLRQPISAIMVHLDLLRDRLDIEEQNGAESNPALKSLTVIRNQVTDLSRTLTLMLEEIQPSERQERGFSLRDALEDVVRLIEPQAAQQEVEVSVELSKHAARMSGSRQMLKQALLNLAVNALDAMPEGGHVKVALDVSDSEAEIEIEDTGMGIPPDVLSHIFEMHYTTKAAGTGVGLFVARDVIERHGGRIEVDTETGRGTLFRVILPVSTNGS